MVLFSASSHRCNGAIDSDLVRTATRRLDNDAEETPIAERAATPRRRRRLRRHAAKTRLASADDQSRAYACAADAAARAAVCVRLSPLGQHTADRADLRR